MKHMTTSTPWHDSLHWSAHRISSALTTVVQCVLKFGRQATLEIVSSCHEVRRRTFAPKPRSCSVSHDRLSLHIDYLRFFSAHPISSELTSVLQLVLRSVPGFVRQDAEVESMCSLQSKAWRGAESWRQELETVM